MTATDGLPGSTPTATGGTTPGFKVIVLGATSAIAEATARCYAEEGASLLLVGRSAERLAVLAADLHARGARTVETTVCNLGAPRDASASFAAMAKTLGGVDHVLLFYGVLGNQARAEQEIAYARDILAVNFLSAAEWCLAAAGELERQGHGRLVVIGSVAGDRGRQSNYIYGSSKAGLDILVTGIAHRFAVRFKNGPRATLIKPGFVDTPMTAAFKKGGPLWATPATIAGIVRRGADRGTPVIYAPWFWRWIMLVIRIMPARLFHRLKL